MGRRKGLGLNEGHKAGEDALEKLLITV